MAHAEGRRRETGEIGQNEPTMDDRGWVKAAENGGDSFPRGGPLPCGPIRALSGGPLARLREPSLPHPPRPNTVSPPRVGRPVVLAVPSSLVGRRCLTLGVEVTAHDPSPATCPRRVWCVAHVARPPATGAARLRPLPQVVTPAWPRTSAPAGRPRLRGPRRNVLTAAGDAPPLDPSVVLM